MGQATIKRSKKTSLPAGHRSRPKARDRRRLEHRRRIRNAVIGVVVVAGLVALFWTTSRRSSTSDTVKVGATAPSFSLSSTAGGTVSLASLRGRNVLLYFSEGVGCDPCFTQMVEMKQQQAQLDQLGVTVVPIMTNSAQLVGQELKRFNVSYPVLIDDSKSVSAEYEVLGRDSMHADLPGHNFVLIDKNGVIRWRGDYSSMYVPTKDLLADVARALKA